MQNTQEKETNWNKTYIQVFVWGIFCVLAFYLFTSVFNLP